MDTASRVEMNGVWPTTSEPDSTKDCTVAMRLSSFADCGEPCVATSARIASRQSRRVRGVARNSLMFMRTQSISVRGRELLLDAYGVRAHSRGFPHRSPAMH